MPNSYFDTLALTMAPVRGHPKFFDVQLDTKVLLKYIAHNMNEYYRYHPSVPCLKFVGYCLSLTYAFMLYCELNFRYFASTKAQDADEQLCGMFFDCAVPGFMVELLEKFAPTSYGCDRLCPSLAGFSLVDLKRTLPPELFYACDSYFYNEHGTVEKFMDIPILKGYPVRYFFPENDPSTTLFKQFAHSCRSGIPKRTSPPLEPTDNIYLALLGSELTCQNCARMSAYFLDTEIPESRPCSTVREIGKSFRQLSPAPASAITSYSTERHESIDSYFCFQSPELSMYAVALGIKMVRKKGREWSSYRCNGDMHWDLGTL